MNLIDTHCHLTALEKGLDDVFADAFKCNVDRMICIGAGDGKQSAFDSLALAERYPHVWASVGIHPHDAKDYVDLEAISSLINHPKVVAIGETGLDFFRDWAPVDRQIELFRQSIRVAKKINKPLIIHCRDADEKVVEILKDEGAAAVGGVFHCYAGDETFATRIAAMNFLISLTGTLTFKKADKLRETARIIPLEQIMLETDAPYMAPEPFRGGASEPMHVYQVALKLAEIKGVTIDEIAKVTTANAERLFKLPTIPA